MLERRPTPTYPTPYRRRKWMERYSNRYRKKYQPKELEKTLARVRRALAELGFHIYTLKSAHATVHPWGFLARRRGSGNFGCLICRIRYGSVVITFLENPQLALWGNEKPSIERSAGELLRFDLIPYNPRRNKKDGSGRFWDWTEMVSQKERKDI